MIQKYCDKCNKLITHHVESIVMENFIIKFKGRICEDCSNKIKSIMKLVLEDSSDIVSRKQVIEAIDNIPEGNWKNSRYSKEIAELPSLVQFA